MIHQKLFPLQPIANPPGGRSKQFLSWAIQQLNIQPYQHLLEIGYGAGHLMEEAARALRIGFIAGIERSIPLYQQAYRRNKQFISDQLLQLHIGELFELSYPAHYFHTIYSVNFHSTTQDTQGELFRLSNLLKTKGRLILLMDTRREQDSAEQIAYNIKTACLNAGLRHIQLERSPLDSDNHMAVSALKA